MRKFTFAAALYFSSFAFAQQSQDICATAPMACFEKGREAVDKNDSKKAFDFFKRSCDLGNYMKACIFVAYILRENARAEESYKIGHKICAQGTKDDCAGYVNALIKMDEQKKHTNHLTEVARKVCLEKSYDFACSIMGLTHLDRNEFSYAIRYTETLCNKPGEFQNDSCKMTGFAALLLAAENLEKACRGNDQDSCDILKKLNVAKPPKFKRK